MRFRPEQHLRRQSDIRAVREQGRRLDGGVFTLWWRQRPETADVPAPLARVCVVASTAAVGGAVWRNRAKRRMRELFRGHQAEVAPGCDLLLIARQGLNRVTANELEQRFTRVLRHIRPGAKPVSGASAARTTGKETS